MKKFLVFTLLMTSITVLYAQEGIRLGAKGSYSSTWLFNKNVSDQNASLDYASTFAGGFGLQAIFMFSETYGMSVEANMNSHTQKYDGYLGNENNEFTNEANLQYIDIPVMFRVSSPRGPYFDIGPQFSFLTKAQETFEGPAGFESYTDRGIMDELETVGIAAVLGFGIDIKITEFLNITTGFRFGYMFSDVTREYSSETEFNDKPENTDAAISYMAHYNADHQLADPRNLFSYENTSRAYGGLQLGLQLKLGGK